MVKSTPEELAARSEVRGRATWHLATFPKPIIGAINGLAYGAGAARFVKFVESFRPGANDKSRTTAAALQSAGIAADKLAKVWKVAK